MAALKRHWKIIVMLVIYVGVAVGGYAYFAAQNPITQLSKVAPATELTLVEKEAKQFFSDTVKAYIFEDQTDFVFPSKLGGFPLTGEAQEQGTELIKQYFTNIDDLHNTDPGIDMTDATVTTVVDPYSYEESRLRPLPNRQALIAVNLTVETETQSGEESFSNGQSLEMGITVDGSTQTITSVMDSSMQGW